MCQVQNPSKGDQLAVIQFHGTLRETAPPEIVFQHADSNRRHVERQRPSPCGPHYPRQAAPFMLEGVGTSSVQHARVTM
jgi:hypothetical protein